MDPNISVIMRFQCSCFELLMFCSKYCLIPNVIVHGYFEIVTFKGKQVVEMYPLRLFCLLFCGLSLKFV